MNNHDDILEIWHVLRQHIEQRDRSTAAEDLVQMLVENGQDPEELSESFASERDLKAALSQYIDDAELDDEDDEEDYDDSEDSDDY